MSTFTVTRAHFEALKDSALKGAGRNAVNNLANAMRLASVMTERDGKAVAVIIDVDAEGNETETVMSERKVIEAFGLTRSVVKRWSAAVLPVYVSGVTLSDVTGSVKDSTVTAVRALSEYVNGQTDDKRVTDDQWLAAGLVEHDGIAGLVDFLREAVEAEAETRKAEREEKAETRKAEKAEAEAAAERAATPEGIIEAIEALVRGLEARRDFLTEDNVEAAHGLAARLGMLVPGTMVAGDASEAEAA